MVSHSMFLSVKKVFCLRVCLYVLCFVRTVTNLKPHLWRTDVLILLTDGINCVYRVSTFGQCVMDCAQNWGNVRHQKWFYLQRRLSVHSVISRALEHLPCHSQTLFFPHLQPLSLLLPGFPFISLQICSLAVSRTPGSRPWLYGPHYLSVFLTLAPVP